MGEPLHPERVRSIDLFQRSEYAHLQDRLSHSIAQLVPALEKRSWSLMQRMEEERKTKDGFMNVTDVLFLWSHDFMVCRCPVARRARTLAPLTESCVQ